DFKNDNQLLQIQEGEFLLKTKNSFPIGATATLYLLNKEKEIIGTLETEDKISPATINNDNTGHFESEDQVLYFVSEETAEKLIDTKHIVIRVAFESTTLNNNQVYSTDAIQFLLTSKMKL